MKKTAIFRSALAMLLCLAMVLSFVPPVKAASTDNFSTSAFEGLKLSILGDSISTFEGVSNSTSYNATLGDNIVFYWKSDANATGVDVRSETWWQQTMDALGMELCVNNSYSGSYTASAFNGDPAAYVDRCVQLHNLSGETPDIIAIYMGSNDVRPLTSTATIGSVESAKKMTVSSTPSTILEAYSVMLQKSMARYPDAEVYCFTLLSPKDEDYNSNRVALEAFNDGVAALAEHFGAYLVDLYRDSGIHADKLSRSYYLADDSHPNEAGMDALSNCFLSSLLENSKYMKEDTYSVSYDLSNALVKTGSVSGTALAGDVRTVIAGKPFEIELGADGNFEIDITVTMGGKDITAETVSGNTVSIDAVTGDIAITATELDSFYWKAESTGLHSGTAFDARYTYNNLTKLSGTYSGATFNSTGVQFQMDEPVNLLHDRPWVMEFETSGSWTNGSMLFSYDKSSSVATNTYLFRASNDGLLAFGFRRNNVYEHYGVSLTSDVKIDASATHVYRLENRLNADGTNTVYLSVDGGTAHPMVQHYDATSDTGTTATELSGRDMTFRYMGGSNHPLRNGTLNWVKIYENGEPETPAAERYRWEASATGLTSVENGTYTENPATLLSGTAADGYHKSAIYALNRSVKLLHDRPWTINWRSMGDYVENPMLFADSSVTLTPYASFVYCNSNGSCVLGWYDPAQALFTNYGVDVSGLNLSDTSYYTYTLKNKITYNADGSYADNMVYLYVDGVEVGPMTTAYPNGTADGTTSDAVSGKDFTFNHFGRTSFTLYDLTLDYIEMNTGCIHSYGQWTVSKAPTCTAEGEQVRSCSLCGEKQTEAVAATGHDYTAVEKEADCLSCAHTAYTCDKCGHSYKVYSEELYSDWSEVKPDVDEALIETKTQYRSSSYETLTSNKPTMNGYELLSSQWVKYGSGTVSYVNSWPSGFDTTNSLYTQYNKKSEKIPASETETDKTVIDSDAVAGYLYYHWCYSDSYYSVASKSGSYTTFHAYYSTTNPNNYVCDTSDMSYKTANAECCTNSDWFFVAEVYDQDYTEYRNEFTYGRWTDFTDWSDTPITGSDTLKVEERTMYRYIDATVGDHDYVGVTTKPTCQSTGKTVYTCSVCGDSYTEELPIGGHTYKNGKCTLCGNTEPAYYLFGYINGANYACEEDYTNMGQYKFENGKLVATFTQDSYVAVKTEGNGAWYMTKEYVNDDRAVLYNTSTGASEKMFVPGGMEITFSLSYSSDDTLTLSYVGTECIHKYEQTVITNPGCLTEGKARYTCSKCGDSYEDVLSATGHDFVKGVCHVCGFVDESYVAPVYYLFGYINGNDYASEADFENRGEFRFEDGKLVVTFTQDSYIGIKTEGNGAWYMTREYVTDTSAVFYNTNTGASEKMLIPACMEVTFTLEETPGDTLTLSYTAIPCPHIYDDQVTLEPGCETPGTVVRTCRICLSSVEEELPAAGHKYEAVVTAPGCLTPGYTTHTCSVCADSYTDSATAATGHDYESKVTKEPTCEAAGVMTYTCRVCSHSYTGEISPSGHVYTSMVTEPSCTTPGYTTYTCSGCGDSYTGDGTPALGHSYRGHTTVVPGCETDGVMTYTCVRCTDSYTEKLEAAGHNYISEATPPTCEEDGYTTHECTVCGYSYADTLRPALGHEYEDGYCINCGKLDPSLAPPSYFLFGYINGANYACEEDYENMGKYEFVDGQLIATFLQDSYIGVKLEDNAAWYMTQSYVTDTSATFYNTNTGVGEKMFVPGGLKITFTLTVNEDDTLTLSYVTAPCDHSYTAQVITEPTCEEDGEKIMTCVLCGHSYNETIDATGHSYTKVITLPTCTDKGYTTYTCSVCEHSYIGDEVKAKGHTIKAVTILEPTCEEDGKVKYTCSVCGYSYTDAIDATGHEYEAVVTAPGCETEGYTTYTCHCGDTYMDDATEPVGHKYKSETILAPGCETEGKQINTCTVCGYSNTEILDPTGHNFSSKIVEPTCTENGYTSHTCTLCGYGYSDTVVPAIGHSYKSVTTSHATCDKAGVITTTCGNCGHSYTEEIAALGHDYKDVTTVEPTCDKAGSITGTCATCGKVNVEEIPAKGHVNKVTVITEATCETDGENRLVCGVCGHSATETVPATGHSYVMGTCTACGKEDPDYTAVNYYLFGYINGANYACEEDYENMGDYLFVGGKLTATFESDSYVAVKTEGNAAWYMTDGWQENVTSVTLYNSESLANADKLLVPGGVELTFTLAENEDGTLTLSYVAKDCSHNYSSKVTTAAGCETEGVKTYTCSLCGDIYTESIPALGHSYKDGICTVCGKEDPSLVGGYVLVTNISQITSGGKFVIVAETAEGHKAMSTAIASGKFAGVDVTVNNNIVTGTDLPVWTVETVDGGIAISIDGSYLTYNSSTNFKLVADTPYTFAVSEGYQLTATAANRGLYYSNSTAKFGAYATSNATNSGYVANLQLYKYQLVCDHSYTGKITTAPTCTTEGIKTYTCDKCGDSYTEALAAAHSFVMGVCKLCGAVDENYVTPNYYLFGYINGANYACEEDFENMGKYQFVNGTLTATFETDSYVAVKTEGNGIWYMTDGWQGEDTSFATLYDSSTLTDANKLFVPGGVKVIFTLTENAEGTLTLSYVVDSAEPSVVPTLSLKYPTVSFEDVIVMNVYYTAANLEDVVEMGLITYSSNVSEWNIENAEEVIPGYSYATDKKMYVSSTNGIAAKCLGDTLYFAVYAKLADGTYTYTKLVSYSPENYAYSQLATGAADIKPLVVAMLKYGAAAQVFFNHNTDALVDRNLTAEQLALIEDYRSDMMTAVANPSAAKQGAFVANGGITRKYPTVSFEGAFEINYYCVPAKTPVDGVTMYYWNQADYDAATVLTAENATEAIPMNGTGTYQAAIKGIAAKDLDKGIYVAFVYSDGTTTYSSGVLAYSIGTYCNASVNGNAGALAKATAVYGYCAKLAFYKEV